MYSLTSMFELLQRPTHPHVVRAKSRYLRYPEERERDLTSWTRISAARPTPRSPPAISP